MAFLPERVDGHADPSPAPDAPEQAPIHIDGGKLFLVLAIVVFGTVLAVRLFT